MDSRLVLKDSDTLGVIASGICLVHCIATPFLFVAKACSMSCCADAPLWWQGLDFLFLVISFLAIQQSLKSTSLPWMHYAMWTSWALLTTALILSYFPAIPFSHMWIYIPSGALITLHIYNMKYCQCNGTACCTHKK